MLNILFSRGYTNGNWTVLCRRCYIACVVWLCVHCSVECCLALGLAASRDNSSGGVLRLAKITGEGVSRIVLAGPDFPTFYSD